MCLSTEKMCSPGSITTAPLPEVANVDPEAEGVEHGPDLTPKPRPAIEKPALLRLPCTAGSLHLAAASTPSQPELVSLSNSLELEGAARPPAGKTVASTDDALQASPRNILQDTVQQQSVATALPPSVAPAAAMPPAAHLSTNSAPKATPPSLLHVDAAAQTEYERVRQERIAANHARMRELGLASGFAAQMGPSPKSRPAVVSATRERKRHPPPRQQPVRRSTRAPLFMHDCPVLLLSALLSLLSPLLCLLAKNLGMSLWLRPFCLESHVA